MTMEEHDDFFADKRPWSVIKDEVLSTYMPPYLAKVQRLGRPILLIDGFSGPGVFDDGSIGSPVIICDAADRLALGNYHAYFINKEPEHHEKLTDVLTKTGRIRRATPLHGDSAKLLPQIRKDLLNQTVFLYLDPFGPTGCPFDLLHPFLTRNTAYSTEVVLMVHMPVVHRLASRKAIESGQGNQSLIDSYHRRLDVTFGGDYWKQALLTPNGNSAEQREYELIEAYRNRIGQHLPYTGYCPVREGEGNRIKYFIVFASRHPDAMLLMNDAMLQAYFKRMHEDQYAGTLFESTNWSDTISTRGLDETILDLVEMNPGITREALWLETVRNNFMRYRRTDFLATVQRLVDTSRLKCPTERKTKRLNDRCVLLIN